MIYLILKHAHSGLRWLVLIALFVSIFNALLKNNSKQVYQKFDKLLNIITLSTVHIQVLIGFILYFISPKVIFKAFSMSNSMLRFFLIEHSLIMILAVVLVTIGYSKSKKSETDSKKFKRIAIFYSIALIAILIAIPWPWMNYSAAWF